MIEILHEFMNVTPTNIIFNNQLPISYMCTTHFCTQKSNFGSLTSLNVKKSKTRDSADAFNCSIAARNL